MQGKLIVHGISIHPHACSVMFILSRTKYLWAQGALPNTPLCAVHVWRQWHSITILALSYTLHGACANVVESLGFPDHNIYIRYLWYKSSMALLLGNINPVKYASLDSVAETKCCAEFTSQNGMTTNKGVCRHNGNCGGLHTHSCSTGNISHFLEVGGGVQEGT